MRFCVFSSEKGMNVKMSEIKKKITQIISKRSVGFGLVDKELQQLEELYLCVKKFKQIQENALDDDLNKKYMMVNPELVNIIGTIDVATFFSYYEKYKEELLKLRERFSRDKLHISFVGKAGQGKSLVLQKISGLGGDIIPASDGTDCTGVRSIITNKKGATGASIHFYTEDELVEVVNNYIEEILHHEGKQYFIRHASDIKRIPIQEIRGKTDYTKVKENSLIDTLEEFIVYYDEYQSYIGKKIEAEPSEIEEYVARYNNIDKQIKYHKSLAVREANIFCEFPNDDAGDIVLVDTIGLGALMVGSEKNMFETIERKSDAIVFMFRPDALRPRVSSDEIDFINKIACKVGHDYAKRLLFWVVNRVESGKGENKNLIPEVMGNINKSNYPINSALDVDCIKDDEVNSKLLLPILNGMIENIEAADNLLIAKTKKNQENVNNAFESIRKNLEQSLASVTNEDIKRQLYPEIQGHADIVRAEIRDLIFQKYNLTRNEPCKVMQDEVEKIICSLESFIPNKQMIINLLRTKNDQHDVLKACTHYMRIQLINAFLGLNTTLASVVNSMKSEVISIFTDDNKGALGKIISYDGINPTKWLNDFVNQIDAQAKYPHIYEALKEFADFMVSVQGFLIFNVRDCLDEIDYMLMKQPPRINSGLEDQDAIAREVIEELRDRVFDISQMIRRNVNDLYKVPNRAMFAALKDLHDRLSNSGIGDDISKGNVEIEWRYMYEDYMPIIFKEEYANNESIKDVADEWNELIAMFKEHSINS